MIKKGVKSLETKAGTKRKMAERKYAGRGDAWNNDKVNIELQVTIVLWIVPIVRRSAASYRLATRLRSRPSSSTSIASEGGC